MFIQSAFESVVFLLLFIFHINQLLHNHIFIVHTHIHIPYTSQALGVCTRVRATVGRIIIAKVIFIILQSVRWTHTITYSMRMWEPIYIVACMGAHCIAHSTIYACTRIIDYHYAEAEYGLRLIQEHFYADIFRIVLKLLLLLLV